MSALDTIRNIFSARFKCIITQSALEGMSDGGAIGEALGLPVVGRTPADLRKFPVTEMLGYGDGITPGGTVSACTDSACNMARFIVDNEVQGLTPPRFLSLINSWYNYKAYDEEDAFKITLSGSVVAGCLFSAMPQYSVDNALKFLPDLACDSVIAPASLFFGTAMYLGRGQKPITAVKNAEKLQKKICSQIGLVVGKDGIEESLRKLLEAFGYCAGDGFPAVVLGAVNSGVVPDLAGFLVGSLAGFISSGSNIPERWRSQLLRAREPREAAQRLYSVVQRLCNTKK